MRLVSFVLLLLTNISAAYADTPFREPPLAGKYSFSGNFEAISTIRYEKVYGMTEEGRTKVRELQKANYECMDTGREIYLCKAFLDSSGSNEVLRGRVKELVQGKKLVLGEKKGDPSLISQGTDVVEYQILQSAAYGAFKYEFYRLLGSSGDWSIRFGTAGEPNYLQFSLSPSGEISMPLTINVTESSMVYFSYLVMADFRRM